jgi:hypothetical protein
MRISCGGNVFTEPFLRKCRCIFAYCTATAVQAASGSKGASTLLVLVLVLARLVLVGRLVWLPLVLVETGWGGKDWIYLA